MSYFFFYTFFCRLEMKLTLLLAHQSTKLIRLIFWVCAANNCIKLLLFCCCWSIICWNTCWSFYLLSIPFFFIFLSSSVTTRSSSISLFWFIITFSLFIFFNTFHCCISYIKSLLLLSSYIFVFFEDFSS